MNVAIAGVVERSQSRPVLSQLDLSDLASELPLGARLDYFDKHNPIDYGVAQAIAKLFWDNYGDRYYQNVTKNPAFIMNEVQSGRWIAFLVTDSEGKALGHGALMAIEPGHYRFARGLVNEQFRGAGLSAVLTEARERYAKQILKPKLLSTEAVTYHAATQKTFGARDFVPTGIFPNKYRDRFETGKPETTLILGRIETAALRTDRAVYLPQAYKAIVASINHALGISRTLVDAPIADVKGEASYRINRDNFEEQGIVGISASGATCGELLSQLAKGEFERGARLVTVSLSTNDPYIGQQVSALRAVGFQFAAYEPGTFEDRLVLLKTESGINALREAAFTMPSASRLKSLILEVEQA